MTGGHELLGFVHYLRDPREEADCAAGDSPHLCKGPLATSDGRQWGFSDPIPPSEPQILVLV